MRVSGRPILSPFSLLFRTTPSHIIFNNVALLIASVGYGCWLLELSQGTFPIFWSRTGQIIAMMPNNNNTVSTSQSLDRLVGTAAIIGLSLAFVLQWLSSDDDDYDDYDVDVVDDSNNQQQQQQQQCEEHIKKSPSRRQIDDNNKSSASASWWWPITILMKRRRKKKKRRKRSSNNIDNSANNNHNRNLDESYETNDDSSSDEGYCCDHLGSCECGAIQFIVSNSCVLVFWSISLTQTTSRRLIVSLL